MSRVYLLADDPYFRRNLERALRKQSHLVHTSALGDFHAAQVREFEPDVVVLDLASNGASAPVRLALLRDPELAEVPLIAVAASLEEARAFGAHAYVPRSLPVDAVPELLETLLRPLRPPLP